MQLPGSLIPVARFRARARRGPQSGDHGTVAPPIPIPKTEVKRCCADDSWAIGPAKVGRRQSIAPPASNEAGGVFFCARPIAGQKRFGVALQSLLECSGDTRATDPFQEAAGDPLRRKREQGKMTKRSQGKR